MNTVNGLESGDSMVFLNDHFAGHEAIFNVHVNNGCAHILLKLYLADAAGIITSGQIKQKKHCS